MGFAAVAAAWSLALVLLRQRADTWRFGEGAPRRLAAKPAPAAPLLEDLGRFPSLRAVYDPAAPGRLHSGGEVSEDGGRTWRPLVGDDGRRIVPLGGSRALAPALRRDGAVLYGEVLFGEPSVPRGLGALAHGAEWRGGRWQALLPVDLSDRYATDEPRWRVAQVAYVRGQPALALENEIRVSSGNSIVTPVSIRALLAASDGTIWVATGDPGRFPLYVDAGATGAWQPVAGAWPVTALAEGVGGVWAVGERLGRRGADGAWQWSPLRGGPADGLAVHPRLPRLAWWGRAGLWLARGAGADARRAPIGDSDVAWAVWEPARDDALILLDRHGFARRLSVGSPR